MATPSTMRAVEITQPGGPEVLKVGTRPVPQPKPGEVLIKVAAAGVNRPDTMQRAGNYPVPPGASDIPGLELAGGVVAVGEGVKDLRVGDTVTALVVGGGYAEYCTAPVPQCLPIPRGMSPVEAASLPETFFTVWSNVFDRGRLAPGESFLVQGGSSGIGVTAIQMVKAFGNRVQLIVQVTEQTGGQGALALEAYPVDPLGKKLLFGVMGDPARLVVNAFTVRLDARLGRAGG